PSCRGPGTPVPIPPVAGTSGSGNSGIPPVADTSGSGNSGIPPVADTSGSGTSGCRERLSPTSRRAARKRAPQREVGPRAKGDSLGSGPLSPGPLTTFGREAHAEGEMTPGPPLTHLTEKAHLNPR